MKQGEIWLINLDPAVGAEIKKTSPAIIVNDNSLEITAENHSADYGLERQIRNSTLDDKIGA